MNEHRYPPDRWMRPIPDVLRHFLDDDDVQLDPTYGNPYNVWWWDGPSPILPADWFPDLDRALAYIDRLPHMRFALEVFVADADGMGNDGRVMITPDTVATFPRNDAAFRGAVR